MSVQIFGSRKRSFLCVIKHLMHVMTTYIHANLLCESEITHRKQGNSVELLLGRSDRCRFMTKSTD